MEVEIVAAERLSQLRDLARADVLGLGCISGIRPELSVQAEWLSAPVLTAQIDLQKLPSLIVA